MKKTAVVFGCFVASFTSHGQRNNPVDSILSEGRLLYRLEMCAWHATNLVLKDDKSIRSNIGDFFSYESGTLLQCVFVSTDTAPKVIARVTMDTSLNVSAAKVEFTMRELNNHERRLHNIRKQSNELILSDTMFARYENTTFNMISVADSFSGKTYIFTEPEANGVVIFGNDYLLQFDKKDSLLQKTPMHPAIIPVDFGKDTDPELIETFHLHSKETGNYITPTDICTLMLYQKFAKWKRHSVISRSFVSCWDLESNELTILSAEQWNKINGGKKMVNLDYR